MYYDLVAETEAEKARARDVVLAITDHLIDHDFQLVDHDGRPHVGPASAPRTSTEACSGRGEGSIR